MLCTADERNCPKSLIVKQDNILILQRCLQVKSPWYMKIKTEENNPKIINLTTTLEASSSSDRFKRKGEEFKSNMHGSHEGGRKRRTEECSCFLFSWARTRKVARVVIFRHPCLTVSGEFCGNSDLKSIRYYRLVHSV